MTGTVLTVTSGKGGVGKTTTALNLGVALRGNGHTVVLVDGDLGMANLAPMLGIEGSATLHDVLAGNATIGDATVEEADGFGIVPGSRDLDAFAGIDPEDLPGMLSTLAGEYDYVVVDAGPGLHYESTLPIEAADEVLLVTTPDSSAIGDTRKIAELAGMMAGDVRGAVVTRATDGTDPKAIAAELGVELLSVIPEDAVVRESTDAGVPLERYAPDSPAAAAYRRLADVLTGVEDAPEPGEPAESPAPGTSGEEPGEEPATAEGSTSGDAEERDGDGEPGGATDEREDARKAEAEEDAGGEESKEGEADGDSGSEESEQAETDEGSGLFARLRGLF